MGWILVLLVTLAGCGRIDFDPVAPPGDTTSAPPWSVVQSAGAKPDMLKVAPIGSGNLIVVAVQIKDTDAVSSLTDDTPGGSNTYVAIPATHAIDANAASGVEIWYATNSRPGATTLVATSGGAAGPQGVVAWEVSWPATVVLDAASGLDSQPTFSTALGAPITSSTAGAFIVSVAILEYSVVGIVPGNEFTNDVTQNANGWAHVTSTSAPAGPHQAAWEQTPPGTYCSGTAAFRSGP